MCLKNGLRLDTVRLRYFCRKRTWRVSTRLSQGYNGAIGIYNGLERLVFAYPKYAIYNHTHTFEPPSPVLRTKKGTITTVESSKAASLLPALPLPPSPPKSLTLIVLLLIEPLSSIGTSASSSICTSRCSFKPPVSRSRINVISGPVEGRRGGLRDKSLCEYKWLEGKSEWRGGGGSGGKLIKNEEFLRI